MPLGSSPKAVREEVLPPVTGFRNAERAVALTRFQSEDFERTRLVRNWPETRLQGAEFCCLLIATRGFKVTLLKPAHKYSAPKEAIWQLSARMLLLNDGNQNIRISETIVPRRKFAHDHGNFVAIGKPGAVDAILVNLVGQILPVGKLETQVGKKTGRSGKQAQASDVMPVRFLYQSFDQQPADTFPFRLRPNGDRADFGEMHPVEVERAAAKNAAMLPGDDEIADVFG